VTDPAKPGPRRPGELNAVEGLRFVWRQLTSMRTALILLLLLALAAVPGSLIPQEDMDGAKAAEWKDAHTTLTPIYEKLGLFDVFGAPWFAAIYLLLMVSLVGCIIPRLFVYWRGFRAQPPAAPRNLTRLPDSAAYTTSESAEDVLARARTLLRRKRYRLRGGGFETVASATSSTTGSAASSADGGGAVSAERGYLREAGNLLFHLSIILVLVGFAMGSLLGYKGGVIVVVGEDYGFSNELTQYDDFDPGTLFSPGMLDDFHFNIDDFSVEWVTDGPRRGMARKFNADLTYAEGGGEEKTYDLRVNHPLTIGGTDVFLIGHGYAPVITVRDGEGNVTYSGPTIFLPENETFQSFGVVKAPYAKPDGIGINGFFYPYALFDDRGNVVYQQGDIGNGRQAMLSMQVWRGDLNISAGPQSVYQLDTSKMHMVTAKGGKAFNLRLGQSVKLPNGLGSVTFEDVKRWNRLQISQQPGKLLALGGVSLALLGLLGSLFIRPRRVWVRARSTGQGTLVEVAALDRSGGGDTATVLSELVAELRGDRADAENPTESPTEQTPSQEEGT